MSSRIASNCSRRRRGDTGRRKVCSSYSFHGAYFEQAEGVVEGRAPGLAQIPVIVKDQYFQAATRVSFRRKN